jgi:hypothetical protein
MNEGRILKNKLKVSQNRLIPRGRKRTRWKQHVRKDVMQNIGRCGRRLIRWSLWKLRWLKRRFDDD